MLLWFLWFSCGVTDFKLRRYPLTHLGVFDFTHTHRVDLSLKLAANHQELGQIITNALC